MLFSNVIVAYDGSENALLAVKKAREIAEMDPFIKVHVTYVTTHPNAQLPANFNNESFDPQQYMLSVDDIIALYNKTVEEETKVVKDGIGDIFEGMEDQVSIDVVPGYTPAADLLAHAKKIGADVIVMGSRGLGAIRGVLGSVSYAVLRESPIPVLVVK